MTFTNGHALASFGAPIGAPTLLRSLGLRIAQRRQQTSERARVRRELQSYSDRELQDLGISRFDIEAVVQGRHIR